MDGLKSNKVYDLYLWLKDGLDYWSDPGEKAAIANEVFFRLLKLSPDQRVLNRDMRLSESAVVRLRKARNRLIKGEPVQYVTGVADFRGLTLHVEPGVLIPRPETEGLVELVIEHVNDNNNNACHEILDLATGSGCIAISLAHSLKNVRVSACDICIQTLEIAKRNALFNNTYINFFICDLSKEDDLGGPETTLNILVSNPPYVRASEKATMSGHVVFHEPEHALFVPDNDPLKFYRFLAKKAIHLLNKKGWLFAEINEAMGKQVVRLLEDEGMECVSLHPDFHGKDRYVKACKPGY